MCTSRVLALGLLFFRLSSLLSSPCGPVAAGPLLLKVPIVPVPSLLSATGSADRPEANEDLRTMKHVYILPVPFVTIVAATT